MAAVLRVVVHWQLGSTAGATLISGYRDSFRLETGNHRPGATCIDSESAGPITHWQADCDWHFNNMYDQSRVRAQLY